ncbi:MAG: acyl-CoA dehydrogenase family protein [Solirubrobacterales bacterium]
MTQPVEAKATDARRLVEAARGLVPSLGERAMAAEEDGRLPAETVRELIDSGLLGADAPGPIPEAAIELARGCGSTAWCYAFWALGASRVSTWSDDVRQEVFDADPDALVCVATAGDDLRCERGADGHLLSGTARFAAGCEHSGWLLLTAEAGDDALEVLVPSADFEVLAETGERSGLRASGSKDLRLDGVLVPERRARTAPGWAADIGGDAPAAWVAAAVTIGLATAGLEATLERLRGTSGKARSADSPVVHLLMSESAADIDAARALMRGDLDDALEKSGRGVPIDELDAARYLRNQAFGAELAMRSVNRIFYIAGGRAISMRDPLQRIHRDAHASLHRPGAAMPPTAPFPLAARAFGQAALGRDPMEVTV